MLHADITNIPSQCSAIHNCVTDQLTVSFNFQYLSFYSVYYLTKDPILNLCHHFRMLKLLFPPFLFFLVICLPLQFDTIKETNNYISLSQLISIFGQSCIV